MSQKTTISLFGALLLLILSVSESNAQSKRKSRSFSKIEQANQVISKDPTLSFKLATQALLYSKKSGDKYTQAEAYKTLGTLYYNTAEYDKAIEHFKQAQKLFEQFKDRKNEEYILNYIAKSYEAKNEAEKTIEYYDKAEKKAASSTDKISYRFNNTKVKIKQGKKDVATEELEKELSDTTSLDQKQKIDMYLELGNLYIEDQKTEEGVELIEKAIDISNKVQSDSIEVVTLNNAWGIYNANGLTAQNFTTQQKALETSEKTNNVSLSSAANYNLGNSYIEENPEIAVSFFEKSVELTKEKPKEVDHIKAVERLSEAYEKSGEYAKALQKYKEYISLVDSIKESEVAGRLRNELLSTKYKIQESKIHELELKQDQKEQAIKTQRNTILGLIMGLLILLGLTYFLVKNIRQKQRSNTLIQLASLRSQMNPHFIFNSLNSVNGFISQNEEIKANRYISDFSKLMRTVLNNSNSPTIPLQDELKSLEIYMALEHSRFEDKFDYEINIDSSIDTLQIEVPPMLIQPYIENAVWHGLRYKENKGLLVLDVKQEDDSLKVIITDNGIGRQKSQELKTTHQRDYKSTGIANTKKRIELLNNLNNRLFSNNKRTKFEVKIIDLFKEESPTGTQVVLYIPISQDINE